MARFWLPAIAASLTVTAFLCLAQSSSRSSEATKEVRFEVLSIKPMAEGGDIYSGGTGNTNPSPNGFVSRLSIFQMIIVAYAPGDYALWRGDQVRNLPNWNGKFYDINARVADADLKAWQHQSLQHELLRSAMRAALRERCNLAIHEEPSKAEDYELGIRKRVPQLQAAVPSFASRTGVKLQSGGVMEQEVVKGGQVKHFYGATMEDLARFLMPLTRGTPVRDRTGLTGRYDFTVREQQAPPDSTPGKDPDYFLEKYPIAHLGLELKRGTESRPILVVDHIERPAAN